MMEGSSCSNPGEELPYKSLVHFYAPNIVTTKLSGPETYDVWKTQMLCLLESHDMLGFITPEVKSVLGNEKVDDFKPVEKSVSGKEKVEDLDEASTSVDAPVKGKDDELEQKFEEDKVVEQGKHDEQELKQDKLWRRSDALVKGWLFGSLTEQALKQVVNFSNKTNNDFTSKDVWDKLQTIYGPAAPLPQVKLNRETENLYHATLSQDLESIEKILSEGLVTLRDKITINGDTALHVAVGTTKNVEFLEKMLEWATIDDQQPLNMRNSEGRTLFHVAAIVGNIEAVQILIKKNINFFFEKDNEDQMPPDIALYDENTYRDWWKTYFKSIDRWTDDMEEEGFYKLMVNMSSSKNYRIVFNTLRNYLDSSGCDLETLLIDFAQNFPPKQLNFWEIIPKCEMILCVHVAALVKYLNHDAKPSNYNAAKFIVNFICGWMTVIGDPSLYHQYYNNAIFEATRRDAYTVVKIFVSNFPNAIWSANEEGHNIIQYAVINRSENTYNLLYQMSEHKNYYKTIKDRFGNNLLHLAGRLAPTIKLDPISGAALQIQHELHWFKEVKGFISPANIAQKNLFDETPQMVFTREHKNLLIEGEKWMKATAESYTITAALIVTVVFAAAITVPGGNNQDNGKPVFTNETAFTIFAISDAISLFTSVTSLLIFLSILTARFAEQDFLFKLPTKLIIGLAALFISTTAMLVAFGATLFLVFGQDNSIILVPIAALTCLPIASFITLQFPLLYDLMSATYGRSIFGKKRIQLIYDRLNAICGRNIGKKTKRPFFY